MDIGIEREQDDKTDENDNKISWKPFLRQLYVVSSVWILNFLNGLGFGLPTVMIPQLRRDANSTEAVSEEMASWLCSVFGYAGLPWIIIICFSIQPIGRKIPFAIVCLNIFATFNLLYFATTLNQILIAEIMEGLTFACNVTINIIVVLEYVSPKYRGLFITIKSANLSWGIWVSNAIGTYYHWRYVPLLGIFLSLFYVTVIFWPESPQWLASKGQFAKCRAEHRWLRGTGTQAEKELTELIQSQSFSMGTKGVRNYCKLGTLRSAMKTVRRKSFYKPMLLSSLMMAQYNYTGKFVFAMYAIDIIKKITDSESTAYTGMLILDGVTIIALYAGCILSLFYNRRTLLFSGALLAIAFLFLTSLYLLLAELGLLVENNIVFLGLMVSFSISISCGPIVLMTPIAGEIIPLRYKSSITMIESLVFMILTSTNLKLFPIMVLTFRMSGVFLFHALTSLFCCTVLYFYLPETKDKTLQEIEHLLMGKKMTAEEKELYPNKEI